VTTVRWDARVQNSVGNYSARANETFVVVQFNATAGDDNDDYAPVTSCCTSTGRTGRPRRSRTRPTRSRASYADADGARRYVASCPCSPCRRTDGATLVETYDGPGVRFQRADLTFDVE